MELDKLLIGIVLISMVSLGIGAFMVDLTGRYGAEVTPEFQTTFDKFNETYSLTEDITENVKEAGTGESSGDVWESIQNGITVIKSVFVQGIPAIFSVVTGLGDTIPVPEYVTRGIQAILLISVAFALVYLYFRYKNG